jgi:predicted alpha/beta superfamily hydrolase
MSNWRLWPIGSILLLSMLTATSSGTADIDQARVMIDSQALEESRTIGVHLPRGYLESQNRYPVLYLLDGEWSFEKFSPVLESMIEERSIPDLIIVSVENVDEHTRLWDFTPTAVEKYPGSGGADTFLQFIQEELIPYVDDNYRTTSVRLICGHSLAGLMSAYTFLNLPDLFSGSIASSPSFSWDNQLMVKSLGNYLKRGSFQGGFLYLAIGSDDFQTYLEAMEKVVPIMEKEAPAGLRWRYQLYQNGNHETVPDRSFPDGIKLFFEK